MSNCRNWWPKTTSNIAIIIFIIYYLLQLLLLPENKNSMLEAEIRSLQRRLVRRDNEILKQERELHKLRVGALEENIYTFIQKNI